MVEDVVTASRDTPLHEVAATMATEEVGSVVVIDDDESPVGIVTDRTIALSVDDEGTLADRAVSNVMAGDVVTVTAGTSVFEVTQRLSEASVRRLPVIDGDGALEGIVAIDDIVVLLSRELENVSDVLSVQSNRR